MAEEQPRIRSTCDACQSAKLKCSRDRPRCARCQAQDKKCVYSVSRRLGRPRRTPEDKAGKAQQQPSAAGSPVPQESQPAETAADSGISTTTTTAELNSYPSASSSGDAEAYLHTPLTLGNFFDTDGFVDHDMHSASHTFNVGHLPDTPAELALPQRMHVDHDPSNPMNHGGRSTSNTSASGSDFDFMSPSVFSMAGSEPGRNGHLSTLASSSLESVPEFFSPRRSSKGSVLGYFDVEISPELPPPSLRDQLPLSDNILNIERTFAIGECGCYSTVLRRMCDLNSAVLDGPSTTIDHIMRLELDVRQEVSQVLDCTICPSSRQRLFLFVAVIVDIVVELLEHVLSESSGMARWSTTGLGGSTTHPSLGGGGSSGGGGTGSRKRSMSSGHDIASVESTSLRLGSYEINGEEKKDFLKFLLKTRLKELSATMRKICDAVQVAKPSANSKAAVAMISETHQRLQTVIRRLVQ